VLDEHLTLEVECIDRMYVNLSVDQFTCGTRTERRAGTTLPQRARAAPNGIGALGQVGPARRLSNTMRAAPRLVQAWSNWQVEGEQVGVHRREQHAHQVALTSEHDVGKSGLEADRTVWAE
jgi:hypothetical protein